jgi:hypothetical protein
MRDPLDALVKIQRAQVVSFNRAETNLRLSLYLWNPELQEEKGAIQTDVVS